MLIMAAIGAATSPFLPVPSMTNVAAGTLTLYLVATGAALTIASGSFFLGQQKIMAAYMRGSPWLFVAVIAPLLLMVFW